MIEDPKPLSKLDEAIIVAVQAHAGEVDKVGEIYIFHPLRVMLILGSAASEEQRIVAVLHDIVEDSSVTLEAVGIQFGTRIQEAVDAITRRSGEPYDTYIGRVEVCALARTAKIADLCDNLDENRVTALDATKLASLRARYKKTLRRLTISH